MTRRHDHRVLAEASRTEAAALVRRIAEPVEAGEHIKGLIARAARRLGFAFRRTEDIWRREARRIDAWEMDLMRRTIERRRKRR